MQFLRISFFIISVAAACLLILYPEIDIEISGKFYESGKGFLYAHNPYIIGVFKIVPLITKIFSLICILAISRKFFINYNWRDTLKTPAVFLLTAALLGPALTVSYGLKEHTGRARPRDIIEFSGSKYFTPATEISSQCTTNCSFSSAHAAMGFYFTSLAWIVPLPYQNIIFLLALSFGSFVGFGRILQGGHFFSDIIFSFIVIMIMNEISFRLWLWLKDKIKSKNTDASKK
jgi:lipid A 4'-phosphatase